MESESTDKVDMLHVNLKKKTEHDVKEVKKEPNY